MKYKECIICRKDFIVRPSREKTQKYCSNSCRGVGQFSVLKRTDIWKKRIGDKLRGRKISDKTRKKLSEGHLGVQAGENHPNWKGGISKDKEYKKEYNKKWILKNPERMKILRSRYQKKYIKKKYLTATRERTDKCECCEKSCKPFFDHNHKTGNFRGWLCQHCNTALGFVNDDIKILENLIAYIKKNNC